MLMLFYKSLSAEISSNEVKQTFVETFKKKYVPVLKGVTILCYETLPLPPVKAHTAHRIICYYL